MSRLLIVTISQSDKDVFQKLCSKMLEDGYELASSSCGFVNNSKYDYQDVWQAIFVLPNNQRAN